MDGVHVPNLKLKVFFELDIDVSGCERDSNDNYSNQSVSLLKCKCKCVESIESSQAPVASLGLIEPTFSRLPLASYLLWYSGWDPVVTSYFRRARQGSAMEIHSCGVTLRRGHWYWELPWDPSFTINHADDSLTLCFFFSLKGMRDAHAQNENMQGRTRKTRYRPLGSGTQVRYL